MQSARCQTPSVSYDKMSTIGAVRRASWLTLILQVLSTGFVYIHDQKSLIGLLQKPFICSLRMNSTPF